MKRQIIKIIHMTKPIRPDMENQKLDTTYFFTPKPLLWNHWVEFQETNKSKKTQKKEKQNNEKTENA